MKYYKLYTSNKQTITLDEVDFAKAVVAMESGSFVKLKNAVVNPSFIVMILPIKKKEAIENEETKQVEGYTDEKTKTFVMTKDMCVRKDGIADKFKP